MPISVRLLLGTLVVLLAVALPAAHAKDDIRRPEGGWRELPVDESLKNQKSRIKSILRNREFAEGEEAMFVKYYFRYELPLWSLEKERARLAGFRVLLARDLTTARTGPPHAKLNELVFVFMSKLCKDDPTKGKFHPASRVNAMMMLGELNSKEMVAATDKPVPLAAAVPVMLEAIADPQQLDAVKVAALGGLIRHGKLGGLTDAESRGKVLAAMLKLAATDAEPGRSEDGHAWMRSMACEVLGHIGTVGSKEEVPKVLASIVGDSSQPFFLRTKAAYALGELKYPAGAFDSAPAALAAGRLIVDACNSENDSDDPFRRRLKARLAGAKAAVEALPASPDAKPSPGQLKKSVAAMWKIFDDKEIEDAPELVAKIMEEVPTLPEVAEPVEEEPASEDEIPEDLPEDEPEDLPDDEPVDEDVEDLPE